MLVSCQDTIIYASRLFSLVMIERYMYIEVYRAAQLRHVILATVTAFVTRLSYFGNILWSIQTVLISSPLCSVFLCCEFSGAVPKCLLYCDVPL
jgi:hypothetical protein